MAAAGEQFDRIFERRMMARRALAGEYARHVGQQFAGRTILFHVGP
jgi:hypothetical protein